jgi:hypothetical protein
MFELLPESGGNTIAVRVSGTLGDADYEAFLPRLEELIEEHGPLRMLVDMHSFEGWEDSSTWDDFAFGMKHCSDFERVALLADKIWEDLVPIHTEKLLEAEVRRFPLTSKETAWNWLSG